MIFKCLKYESKYYSYYYLSTIGFTFLSKNICSPHGFKVGK